MVAGAYHRREALTGMAQCSHNAAQTRRQDIAESVACSVSITVVNVNVKTVSMARNIAAERRRFQPQSRFPHIIRGISPTTENGTKNGTTYIASFVERSRVDSRQMNEQRYGRLISLPERQQALRRVEKDNAETIRIDILKI